MPYKSLLHFVNILEENNDLIRVREFVNPELEITEITDRFSKSSDGGKALLFENNGTNFPVLINAFGSEKRMCLALGVNNLDEVGDKIQDLFGALTLPKKGLLDKLKILPILSKVGSWMPKKINGKGSCQEIIYNDPDLSILPILKCWPEDGGRFVTLPMVITKDPITGIRNVGMYRMQVFDKSLTGMHWHMHKVGARHFSEYKKLGKKMPVAVALGGDPAYTYSATAPLPDNVDEFLFAGFLRKRRVELVKCITQDIDVPADADIIIEGYVDPEEEFILEGPFGDHTGFYSLADMYPKFHVTCITHRKNAVYPATIVGIPPMEDAWIGKATERIFLTPIRISMLPEIIDFNLPFVGVAHNLAIVKIHKTYPGQAIKVMNSLWGAGQMMFNKVLIVVDQNVDIHNYNEVLKALEQNMDISADLHFSMGPLDILDHSSSKYAYGSKLGIDATKKWKEEIKEEVYLKNKSDVIFDAEMLMKEFPEIYNLNNIGGLLNLSIIALDKTKNADLYELSQKLASHRLFVCKSSISIFVDKETDVNDFDMIAWLTLGNIDPKRDSIILSGINNNALFINGTRKSLGSDKFQRDWPNIIVSDISIIEYIDKNWDRLGLGPFIQSPSLKYKKMYFNGGAKVSG
jgi:4-hydroxy-3-polyprenylbenzoate decarboxylase